MRTIRPIVISLHMVALITIVASFALIACDRGQSSQASTRDITVQQLKSLLDSDRDIFLIDVRTAQEYEAYRIDGVDKQIPYDKLTQFADQIPQDKATDMYCFCRTGRRSGIAAGILSGMGYTNVHNVTGGIHAWQAAGYKTISGPISGD